MAAANGSPIERSPIDADDSSSSVSDTVVAVNIRCSNGSKFTVQTPLGSTVGEFKVLVAEDCDVAADQQRLIYKGRILKDDQTLESYGLQADHTVHMVKGFVSSGSQSTTAAASARNAPTTTGFAHNTTSNDSRGADLGAPHFPGLGLGGLVGSRGSGSPDLEQVQQQLTQSLMNNPDLIRSLVMNNPQMREVIDRNPQLAHVLNDPNILRQTLETARNPELMREMMRNTDRAMSNIESLPGGFNMLRRMYENVQEPLHNATMAGSARNNLSSNLFAALLGNDGLQQTNGVNNPSATESESPAVPISPNVDPLPNPWNSGSGAVQTTSGRSNPSGIAGPPSLPGLGTAGGLPGLGNTLRTAPDPALLLQLLQNPAISQMMQSVLSNPQFLNLLFNSHPTLRAMSEMNPQFREMFRSPELLRQLPSPEMMQSMLALQQTPFSSANRPQANQDSAQTGAVPGSANDMRLDILMNMFGGLAGRGLDVPANSNVPLEELYATQLSQLQEMGFFDTQENIRALQATRGNIHAAVERLLGNSGQ